MPLWLIPILGAARKGAGALFGAVVRNPWPAACVALLLACAWLWHGEHRAAAKLQDCAAERMTLNDRLAVSNASVATLQKSLSDYVGAGKAAKIAQLAAVQAQAKDNVELQIQADAIRQEVAAMKPDGKCATPPSVRAAKGL